MRYLGIYINRRLTWSDHCKFVSSIGSKTLNLLRRLLHCCSPSAKWLSFCALVLPIIQYCCTFWLPHYNTDINHLEAIQFQYRAVLWNSLPVSVCNLSSHKVFRFSVIDHFAYVIFISFLYASVIVK